MLLMLLLCALPAVAFAHASIVTSSPALETAVPTSPAKVQIQFSEPVQLLQGTDLRVVDDRGDPVTIGAGSVSPTDSSLIEIRLKQQLSNGTYTVLYKVVSADSHIVAGARAFAIGPGPVGPPHLGSGANQGPSESSPWSVSARLFELLGLGGLFGLLGYRWLIWGPVWRRPELASLPEDDRRAALEWGRDVFWVVFGVLAVGAMIAEAYLLIVYSASALGTSVSSALRNTSGVGDVLASTRFGSLLQLRGGLLFALFAIGAWQFLAEFGSNAAPKPASAAGARVPAAIMGALVLVVLYGISSQGHASQAPWAPLQIAADLTHLAAAAVWIAGLAMLIGVLLRMPRTVRTGTRVGAAVLSRFSAVALVMVGLVVLTGTIRSIGQLSDPAQLWTTGYGDSIMIKLALLSAITLLALWNRRVTNSIERVAVPSRASLAMVRRAVMVELTLAIVTVGVAALLVAQVPGRV